MQNYGGACSQENRIERKPCKIDCYSNSTRRKECMCYKDTWYFKESLTISLSIILPHFSHNKYFFAF